MIVDEVKVFASNMIFLFNFIIETSMDNSFSKEHCQAYYLWWLLNLFLLIELFFIYILIAN